MSCFVPYHSKSKTGQYGPILNKGQYWFASETPSIGSEADVVKRVDG